MMAAIVVLMGVLAGVMHAFLLRRTARSGVSPFGALARLVLVAGVLVAAAVLGHLLAGVAGWISGFGVAGLAIVWRWS